MKTLSALEINYLIKELDFLIGAKIDKIYALRRKELILQLFVPSKGKHYLKIDEKSFYLTDNKPAAETPSDFCMYMRKKLGNARLRKIRQLDFERIISLEFETKTATFQLVAELFSKGNILLLKDNKILVAAEYQNWKDRVIRPKEDYKYPKKEYNFLELTESQFKKLIETTNKENIVKTLAIELGLGGLYSEEACFTAGIDKNKKAKDLTQAEKKKLLTALEKLRSQNPSPVKVYKDKELIDLTPFNLNLYSGYNKEPAETYSQLLNSYFSKESTIKQKEKQNKKIDEIKEIIKNQEEDIKRLEKQEIENKEKGELLYNNYTLVSNTLSELQEISKTHNWKEIKDKLKDHKLVKEVIPKEKSVVVEI